MRAKYVFAAFVILLCLSFAKSFSIPSSELTYSIAGNGLVHVKEVINYNLVCDEERFHELYLQKPKDLVIMNADGRCIGDECTFRIDEPSKSVSGDRELILSMKNGCGNVVGVFEYDVKAIKLYKDTAQFYYKVWGDKWSEPTDLTVNIVLPGNVADTEHFLHYWYEENPEVSMSGNKIIIKARQPAYEMLEINLLMPLNWFSGNEYYYYDKEHTKKDIIETEKQSEANVKLIKIFNLIVAPILLIVLPIAIFVFAYLFYGREYSPAQVSYAGIYEHEPPSRHAPAECIFFLTGNDKYGDKETANAISSTIMSLVNKGIMDIQQSDNNIVFKFTGKSGEDLKPYEKELLEFLESKAIDGEISLKQFKNKIAPKRSFYLFVKRWIANVKKEIKVKMYVDYTGYNIASKAIYVHLGILFLLIFCVAQTNLFNQNILLVVASFIIDAALLRIMTSRKNILGRWTKEGRVLNLKWKNFKKYLADFSALEEHPPTSVKLWDEYMTYAIALDVADKTIKAMKKIAPQYIPQTKVARTYTNTYFAAAFISSIRPTYSPPSSTSHRIGGYGGGFGGGGGGAR